MTLSVEIAVSALAEDWVCDRFTPLFTDLAEVLPATIFNAFIVQYRPVVDEVIVEDEHTARCFMGCRECENSRFQCVFTRDMSHFRLEFRQLCEHFGPRYVPGAQRHGWGIINCGLGFQAVLERRRERGGWIKYLGENCFYAQCYRCLYSLLDPMTPAAEMLAHSGRSKTARRRDRDRSEDRGRTWADLLARLGGRSLTYVTRGWTPTGALEHAGGHVGFFVWIHPMAVAALAQADCELLDMSFFACRPYVWGAPCAIIGGTAVPLGLVIAQSESSEVMIIFHDLLLECATAAGVPIALDRLPLVADGGSGIARYAALTKRRLLPCLYHLPRKFDNIEMARIISWVMYTYDRREWYGVKKWRAVARITAASQLRDCTKGQVDEAFKLIGYNPKTEEFYLRNPPFAMSERLGFEATTNKVERFHEIANSQTRLGRTIERIWKVLELIMKRMGNAATEGRQRSAFERARRAGGRPELGVGPCDCGESRHWMALYRARDFPCPHRAGFPLVLEDFPVLDVHPFPPHAVVEEPEFGTVGVLALWESGGEAPSADPTFPGERDSAVEEMGEELPEDVRSFVHVTCNEVAALAKRSDGNSAFFFQNRPPSIAMALDYERAFHGAAPSSVEVFHLEFWRACWLHAALTNSLNAALAAIERGQRVGFATEKERKAALGKRAV